MERFDHVAKLGRDRGRVSPIPESPAMATLTGRMNASTNGWIAINWTPVKKVTPMIPYWNSREPSAPAIAPTTTHIVAPARA